METLSALPGIENYRDRIDLLLKERGVSDIEIGLPQVLEVKIASLVDQSNQEKSDKVRKETLAVMEVLGLDPDSRIKIEKRKISFNEDVSTSKMAGVFPDRQVKQNLTHYLFASDALNGEGDIVLATFSHGGAIRENTIEKSPFLALINELARKESVPLVLSSVNHRGSSPDSKESYSLWDRETDLIITQQVMMSGELLGGVDLSRRKAKTVLIGNSMGGDVATLASKDLMPSVLILPQPAAYPEKAHFVPLGPKFTEIIREKDAWKSSPSFDALEEFLSKGGKGLIIGAREDETIPGGVTKRYMKEVTFAYANRSVTVEGKTHFTGLMWIDVGHTSTTPDEIRVIVESLKA